jgi:hypothetical protein
VGAKWAFRKPAAYTDAPQSFGEIFVMRYDGAHVEQGERHLGCTLRSWIDHYNRARLEKVAA